MRYAVKMEWYGSIVDEIEVYRQLSGHERRHIVNVKLAEQLESPRTDHYFMHINWRASGVW